MLRNCDKIITPISSTTTNHWPQIVLDDHKSSMASSSTNNKAMAVSDKAHQDPHQPLRCPRCDSSNTKFCYYNNYSLSQPRHFCKACKRYWTRGGTLRNVPVGGGCRKNKRPKRRPSAAAEGISSAVASAAAANPSVQPQMNTSSHVQTPRFYGLPSNPLELNFPFSNFRVSSDATGFDLLPQINDLGLGFSSNNGYKPIQDAISNSTSSPFSTSANNSIFFGSSSSFSNSSTMASLLASTLQQQKNITIPSLMPYEDPQMPGNDTSKQVKAEGENRLAWNPNPNPNSTPNPIDQINSSDPSSLLWNATSIGAWFDPSSMGSSVPSLI